MREAGRRPVRIGCSGWNYASWRNGVFYPARCPSRLWLEWYARSFDTVEVNATFYRLPTTKAVQGWVDQTPDDFCFAVKGSRYLTHVKRLRDLGPGLARFMERLDPLVRSPKLGPLLWQLPPNLARDDERLADALRALPPGRHCFEFRHPSWFANDVYALLRGHGASLAMGETGMSEMAHMSMQLPENTLPMMTGNGPFGPVEMGGMFTVIKVREGLSRTDYTDPGWYEHPPGTVAWKASDEELRRLAG